MVPGGQLLLYVPAFMLLHTSMDHKIGHFRRYRRTRLGDALVAAGFEIERAHYVDCLGFAAVLLFRALDNGSGDVTSAMLKVYDRYPFPLSLLLDRVASRFFGKNLLIVATRPAE